MTTRPRLKADPFISTMEVRFMLRYAIILSVFVVSMCPALAQGPTAAEREACAADVKKFCADVKPGGGRIRDCLSQHANELLDSCRTAVEARSKAK